MKKKLTKFPAFLIAALILLLTISVTFAAEEKQDEKVPSAEEIWKKMKNVNPSLNDYEVDIKVKVKGKYLFLNPNLNLEGKYYYKKPDKHKLHLTRGSQFLNKYPNIFGWSLPELKYFNSTVRRVKHSDREYYVVQLKKKIVNSDLLAEEIWVNSKNYTFPLHIYKYKNNGFIKLKINYRKEQGYMLFNRMFANFSMPKIGLTAEADASYGKYNINIGLSDDFFEDDKK